MKMTPSELHAEANCLLAAAYAKRRNDRGGAPTPPLCKGRWQARPQGATDGGVVQSSARFEEADNPSVSDGVPPPSTAPLAQGSQRKRCGIPRRRLRRLLGMTETRRGRQVCHPEGVARGIPHLSQSVFVFVILSGATDGSAAEGS